VPLRRSRGGLGGPALPGPGLGGGLILSNNTGDLRLIRRRLRSHFLKVGVWDRSRLRPTCLSFVLKDRFRLFPGRSPTATTGTVGTLSVFDGRFESFGHVLVTGPTLPLHPGQDPGRIGLGNVRLEIRHGDPQLPEKDYKPLGGDPEIFC
jgi:hypothetical protein